MGLLQKLSENGLEPPKKEVLPVEDKPVVLKKSNSVGLLKKSLMASEVHKLDFFEFTGKYNLEICALFKNQEGTYKISNCIGFDGESICLSVSTADFWDGTITQPHKLYSFSANSSEALPFFQFFSKALKEKIYSIQIIKTNDNSILLACNAEFKDTSTIFDELEITQNIQIDFNEGNAGVSQNYAASYTLDFSEALESFILSNSKNDIKFTKIILDEIYFNLQKNFPSPDFVEYSPKGKFKLYISQLLPVELLYNHIRYENSFILANHSELLSVVENQSEVEQ